jgi:L-alanine-DL-glutamate epimerase-like enolase superfamily enzyme
MALISRIQVHSFSYPAKNLVRNLDVGPRQGMIHYARGAQLRMKGFLVVIETEDGARGEFCPYMGGTEPALAETMKLAPSLIGRDPFERERLYQQLKVLSRAGEGAGIGPLDIALWDLCGKLQGQSVGRMLGGWKHRLPAYVSTWRGDRNGGLDSVGAFVDFASDVASRGIGGFKIHSWPEADAGEETDLVLALGRAVGGRIDLMHDPACVYRTFADGLTVGRACDEAGFKWIEDPFVDVGRSFAMHNRLKSMIRTPILLGERLRGLEAKANLIVSGATDMLRADPEMDLGITGMMKAAALAEAFGMDVEVANCSPAQRHCLSAMRNAHWYEICNVGPDCPNATPPIYACGYDDQLDSIASDGCVSVPNGPGLGVRYDHAYVDAHRIDLFEVTRETLGSLYATPQ